MTNFTVKKINKENSLGQLLSEARLANHFKIEDLSKRLNIRKEYLTALEDDRHDLLPSGIYGRNFLKRYASFLKIDSKIITQAEKEMKGQEKDDPFSKKVIRKNHLIAFPKIIRNLLLAFAVLICSLYLAFYARKIVTPPKLIIEQPAGNMLTTEKNLTISGITESEAELRINNELVLNNNDGLFSQEVNLKKGLNNITISAKKKYSKENIITRQILVE